MQAFKYKGVDAQGARVEGEISAASLDDAERKVAGQEVTIISIVPVGLRARGARPSKSVPESASRLALRRSGRVRDADIAAILRDLSIMAETGVPFVEALDAVIVTSSSERLAVGLRTLREHVVGGKSLSEGMQAAGGLFPSIVCEMVRVAEEGGRLERALLSAAHYLERGAELRRKVLNAMLYPAVLTVIAVLAVGVLVTFVLPKFSGIFKTMGAEVPAATQAILSCGEALRSNPWFFAGGLAALAFAMKASLRLPPVQRFASLALLRIPVLGELIRRLSIARAFQSIATLLSCNVSLMSALEHGAKVSGNSAIEEALLEVRSGVEHGGSFSECLAATQAFSPMLVQMVSIGERTGRLASLMATTASHLEEEVDARLKALVSIVEPVMIAVMGCVVGFITISIITPIYSVVQNIK